MPLVDEHVTGVGREVREFARLHLMLAREEATQGSKNFVRSLFLIGFGVSAGGLVLVAAGTALFLWLARVMDPAGAAALVAIVLLAVSSLSLWGGWRWLKSSKSLFLPETRRMLWELVTCPDEPASLSRSSAPGDHR
jgi:uncharacterized membrane protein YqjE